MKKLAVALFATLALVLAGCTSGSTDVSPPQGDNADSSSPATKAEEKKAPQPVLGEAYTWEDGLTIKTNPAKSFKPSEFAAGGAKSPAHILLEFTIVNKTGKIFDPSLVNINVQSGNEEADPVFDDDISSPPNTKLLDGREAKFTMGYGVKDAEDLVVVVQPDIGLEYVDAIFTSK